MPSLFFRIQTDRNEIPVGLENMYAGPVPATCWLVGGGKSLGALPWKLIETSPAPVMSINLSGTGLIRPDFWTSYDPSVRFHKSVYLDPGIMKFVHKRRAMDLVPETSYKVCDCPNLYFFERDRERQFHDFVSQSHSGIVDWADSFVQAIDILYRLGFRRIYLAGCEMTIAPSKAQIEKAELHGVVYESGELLREFVRRCQKAGLSESELEKVERETQYHFEEQKSLRAGINSEFHYFRVAQYLRLSRRAMALEGLQLISVTPESRLNDYFPFLTVEDALAAIHSSVGNPAEEQTAGLYQQLNDRRADIRGPMRDFKPPHEPSRDSAPIEVDQKEKPDQVQKPEFLVEEEGYESPKPKKQFREKVSGLKASCPDINEVG